VARELFAEQGVQRTSLREIAERLNISKPALYYHFRSREDLVRSIVQPLLDQGESFVIEQEGRRDVSGRDLLGGYFDMFYEQRGDLMFILAELPMLTELGLVSKVFDWRQRLMACLVGPDATLERQARAVLALGGLQDCTIQFPDAPYEELKQASVNAACAALGID
jgi:AcrR family transcriptional regulator